MKTHFRIGHSDGYAAYSLKVYQADNDFVLPLKTEYLIPYDKSATLFHLYEELNYLMQKEMTLWQRLKWALFGVKR